MAGWSQFPAATATGMPRFQAVVIAFCSSGEHPPGIDRDMLITSARLDGAFAAPTVSPASQRTASAMSET